MNLFEFEGKALMCQYGIPVPESILLTDASRPAPFPYPFVLKAQTLTGGRGKAGGIQICRNDSEYQKYASHILDMTIKDHPVHGLLAEALTPVTQEFYLAITLQGVSRPTLIFSAAGGMDIEEVSRVQPDAIVKLELDPFLGLKDYQKKYIASKIPEIPAETVFTLLDGVQRAFFETKALLVEINPLGAADGSLIALDSKFVLDDHAKSMQDTLAALAGRRSRLHNWNPPAPEQTTITYVPLEGEIALISDGAGTGMLTLDLLEEAGLHVGSFCELGGMTSEEVMERAMTLSLESRPEIKGLFISLIGGFNRMDNMAAGITKYVRSHCVQIPIYTRMCGNQEEVGLEIMRAAGLKTFDALLDAVGSFALAMKGGTA